MDKQRVLFLCTHNSARNQMAEGMVRHLAGDRFDAYSTGTEATRVHPLVLQRDFGKSFMSHLTFAMAA